jgi:hypothetical protein
MPYARNVVKQVLACQSRPEKMLVISMAVRTDAVPGIIISKLPLIGRNWKWQASHLSYQKRSSRPSCATQLHQINQVAFATAKCACELTKNQQLYVHSS